MKSSQLGRLKVIVARLGILLLLTFSSLVSTAGTAAASTSFDFNQQQGSGTPYQDGNMDNYNMYGYPQGGNVDQGQSGSMSGSQQAGYPTQGLYGNVSGNQPNYPSQGQGMTYGGNPAVGGSIFLNGTVVGVLQPQTQIAHPSLYLETGQTGTASWLITAPAGAVIIAGGVTINGETNGVYETWQGGTPVQVNVFNGFVLVTTQDWGQPEFCFRVGQAVTFGWAHSIVRSPWNCQF